MYHLEQSPSNKSNLSASSYTSSLIFKNISTQIFMNEGVKSCRETGYLFLFLNSNFGRQCQAYQILKAVTEIFYAICKGNNLSSYKWEGVVVKQRAMKGVHYMFSNLQRTVRTYRKNSLLWLLHIKVQWCALCEALLTMAGWSSSQ